MVPLRLEPHRRPIAPPRLRLNIIRPRRMPRQSQQDRAIRPIIIIVLLLQSRRDLVVHLLVVLKDRRERALGGRREAVRLPVDVVTRAGGAEEATEPVERAGPRGLGGRSAAGAGAALGGVAAARLAEGLAREGVGGGASWGGAEGCAGEGAGCGGGHFEGCFVVKHFFFFSR